MRLLICTQTVDSSDPVLGFFHRWVEEFAKHADQVIVICLRKGVHSLPKNVEVISLGETNRIVRALELCTIIVGRRSEYDTVFVHMNPEYIAAAGWLWRLLGKKIGLWYTHKSVDLKLRIAARLANVVMTASKESFRLSTASPVIIGHGIDTDFFTPDTKTQRGTHILSVGRLMKSKRHDLIIRAAKKAGRVLRIAGDGPERLMLERIKKEEGDVVEFLGGLTQDELRDEYRQAAHFVHASTTGSMDKVVLEAAACDCNVITTTWGLYDSIPVQSVSDTPDAIAEAILATPRVSADRVSIIREKHSLKGCIEKIIWNLRK